MIITRFYGGLGNQMFQYAISLAILKKYKTNFYLDLSYYSKKKIDVHPRQFLLHHFFSVKNQKYILKKSLMLSFLTYFNCFKKRFLIKEKKGFIFDQSLLEKKPPFILDGYWQSYIYFENIKSDLQKLYLNPKGLNKANKEMLKKINHTRSVCVHIRRGDYISNPRANSFHGVLTQNYYKKALKVLGKLVPKAHYFIFSDDVEWVRLNPPPPAIPYTIVDINDESKPYFDLWLMGHCKYFIIANSSLSWWAAYLAKFKNKIVIAPTYWLRHLKSEDTDLIPPEWILISD
jgi:hypothetical protein